MKILWKFLSNNKLHFLLIILTFVFSLNSFFLKNKNLNLNSILFKISKRENKKTIINEGFSTPAFNKNFSNIFLSVIIPLYDIEINKNNNNIELPFLENLVLELKKFNISKYELFFIIDKENNKTFDEEYLKKINNFYSDIEIFFVSKKYLGSGNMILNGLNYARGEYIMILNEKILNYNFLEKILNNKNKNKIYYGYKNNYTYIERIFNYYAKKNLDININDFYSNIIIMTKEDLKKIFNELTSLFSFQIKYEILKLAKKYYIKINQFEYKIENNKIDIFNNYFNKLKIREFLYFFKDILGNYKYLIK